MMSALERNMPPKRATMHPVMVAAHLYLCSIQMLKAAHATMIVQRDNASSG